VICGQYVKHGLSCNSRPVGSSHCSAIGQPLVMDSENVSEKSISVFVSIFLIPQIRVIHFDHTLILGQAVFEREI
jgi:hypothetical protein